MSEVNKPFHVPERGWFKAIPSPLPDSCTGCAGDGKGNTPLCMALPVGCSTQKVIYVSTEAPGNMPNIVAEPSPVSTVSAAGVQRPAHGGYPVGHTGLTPQQAGTNHGFARNTDPQTSHDAAKDVAQGGGKLIDRILIVMSGGYYEPREQGWTGKELAADLNAPLNSVTPRFAQLRRQGLIHAAGKRDKQIVWKLGNGVAA